MKGCGAPFLWRPPWVLSFLLICFLHLPAPSSPAAVACDVFINANGTWVMCNKPEVVAVSTGPSGPPPSLLNVTNFCQLPPSLPPSQPAPMLALCIPEATHVIISNLSMSDMLIEQGAYGIALVVGPGSSLTLLEGSAIGVTGVTPLVVMLGTGSKATISNYIAINNTLPDRSAAGMQILTYSDQYNTDPTSVSAPAANFSIAVRNCTFQRNVGFRAAGLLAAFPGAVNWRFTIANTVFVSNRAVGAGGGGAVLLNASFAQAGVITMQDVVVMSNTAVNGSGGGVLADLTSSVDVMMNVNGTRGVIIQRNKALQGAGGGMWLGMGNATRSWLTFGGAGVKFDRNVAISGAGLFANLTNSTDCRVQVGCNEAVFTANVAVAPVMESAGNGQRLGDGGDYNNNGGYNNYNNDAGFRPVAPVTFSDPIFSAGIDVGFIRNETVVSLSGVGGGIFISLVGSLRSGFRTTGNGTGRVGSNRALSGAGMYIDLAADYGMKDVFGLLGVGGDGGLVPDGYVPQGDFQAVQAVPAVLTSAPLAFGTSNWRIESNVAAHRGGGLYVSLRNTSSPVVRVNGATNFFNNSAGIAGGGMYVDEQYSSQPQVVLNGSDLVFESNSAGAGAGLYINQQYSSTTCDVLLGAAGQTKYSNNTAGFHGGGIMVNQTGCNSSTVTLTGGKFLFVANTAGGCGGGIAVNQTSTTSALVSVNGTFAAFLNNSAIVGNGGAIAANQTACSNATVDIDGIFSNFFNNSAGTNGGGVSADQANCPTARVVVNGRRTALTSNTALRGAGLFADHTNVSDTLVIIGGYNTSINGNQAGSVGGGVLIAQPNSSQPKVSFTGTHIQFANNNATLGGGVYVQQTNATDGSLTIVSIAPVFLSNIASVSGAGLYLDHENAINSSLLILSQASVFQNNTAGQSGGATYAEYSNSTNTLVLLGGLNISMTNNTCRRSGGGIRLSLNDAISPQVLINSSAAFFFNNSAGSGGFLSASLVKATNARITVNGSTIMQGNVANYSGGAMYLDMSASNTTLWINATEADGPISFVDNVASSGSGGGIYVGLDPLDPWSSSQVVIDGCEQGCEFRNNSAVRGGGLLISGDARNYSACPAVNVTQCNAPPLQLSNYRFALNRAVKGGGVMTSNTTVSLVQLSFENNTSDDAGGGLYVDSSWKTWIVNSNFSFNRAFRGGGIALIQGDDEKSQMILVNSTSVRNLASTDGGAILIDGGTAAVSNSTMILNTARLHGGGICFISRQCVRGRTCTAPSTSPISLDSMTNITKNQALAGGGMFVSAWSDTMYNVTDFVNGSDVAVNGNGASYSRDLSLPPLLLDVNETVQDMVFPSTGGDRGLIPLVVNVSTPGIQVRVDIIGLNPQTSNASLLGFLESSARGGIATFDKLRILGGAPGMVRGENDTFYNATVYNLRVSTPDYPLIDPQDIQITIRSCVAGEFHENSTNTCNICTIGTYTVSPNQTACRVCGSDTSSTCDWGAIKPTEGHWQASFKSETIRPCPNFQACYGINYLATVNDTVNQEFEQLILDCQMSNGSIPKCQNRAYSDRFCSQGYRGHLCASCAEGWGKNKLYKCGQCVSKSSARGMYAATLLITCAVVIFTSNSVVSTGILPPEQNQPITFADLFKVVSVYLQYLGVIGTLNVGRPDGLKNVFAVQDAVGSGPTRSVAMSCMGITNVGVELWLTILFPFIVAAVGFPLWSVFCAVASDTVRLGRMAAVQAWNSVPDFDLLVIVTMVAIQFSYSVMLYTAFAPFVCLSVYLTSTESVRYWGWDMDVRCGTKDHLRLGIPVGVIGVVGACLAIPLALIFGLKALPLVPKLRHRIRYNFLYRQYRSRRRWWEGVVCIRTAVLVAFSLFFKQYGVSKQLVTMIALLLTDTLITLWQIPYKFRIVHMLNIASNMVLMVTCLGSLALPDLDGLFTLNDGMLTDGFRVFQKGLILALLLFNVLFVALIVWIAVLVEVAKAENNGEGMLASKAFGKVFKILSFLTCGMANRELMEEHDDGDNAHTAVRTREEHDEEGGSIIANDSPMDGKVSGDGKYQELGLGKAVKEQVGKALASRRLMSADVSSVDQADWATPDSSFGQGKVYALELATRDTDHNGSSSSMGSSRG